MASLSLNISARDVPEVRAELERQAARIAVLSTALNEAAAELECEELELAAKKARAALAPDESASTLLERVRKAEAFKAYVHQRLDAAGVPADPEPVQNAEHGCRIEGRLNWLIGRLLMLREVADETLTAIDDVESEPGRGQGSLFKVDWLRGLKALRDTAGIRGRRG